mmetsp:Transcript_21931/g.65757  ORF Transcript_21931/g.65757 Transcript_21931/m.65757 type:complete len:260 (+) Transcript_21931:333-1112(+)
MSELDVHLAAAYLKRVSLSSSALDELLEEESTRKLRRVNSSNGLETGRSVKESVRFDGSPKAKEPRRDLQVDELRRVVSAEEMLGLARAARDSGAGDTTPPIPENPSGPAADGQSKTVSDDGTDGSLAEKRDVTGTTACTREQLEKLLNELDESGALGPVELGRCRELSETSDDFVRRGLADALQAAVERGEWGELGSLVDIHRRARPYDIRDDLRRSIAIAKRDAVAFRIAGKTDEAISAMRELKKLQWQLQHVTDML